MAAAGATLPEITSAIAGEYSIPEAQANADALRLVNQFIEEQLLFPHTYSTVPQPPAADMPPTPYTTPNSKSIARWDTYLR